MLKRKKIERFSWVIATAITIALSVLNFAAQKYSAEITVSLEAAKDYLLIFSKIILFTGLVSHTVFFAKSNSEKVEIDGSIFLIAVVTAAFVFYETPLLAIGLVPIFWLNILKEFYKLFGEVIRPGPIRIVVYFSLVFIAWASAYHSISFQADEKVIVLLYFLVHALPILILSRSRRPIQFEFNFKLIYGTLMVYAAELLPFASAYILYISSAEKLSLESFVSWREVLAVLGLSGIVGAIFLNIFTRKYRIIPSHLRYMTWTALLCGGAAAVSATQGNVKIGIVLVLFSISSILHNFNKITLSRVKYLIVTAVGPVCIILWHKFFIKQAELDDYFSLIIMTQVVHVLFSFCMREKDIMKINKS